MQLCSLQDVPDLTLTLISKQNAREDAIIPPGCVATSNMYAIRAVGRPNVYQPAVVVTVAGT
jgi:hypothetical protein